MRIALVPYILLPDIVLCSVFPRMADNQHPVLLSTRVIFYQVSQLQNHSPQTEQASPAFSLWTFLHNSLGPHSIRSPTHRTDCCYRNSGNYTLPFWFQ